MVLKCKNINHEKQKKDISYLTDFYGEEEEGIYENRQQAWKGKEYSPSLSIVHPWNQKLWEWGFEQLRDCSQKGKWYRKDVHVLRPTQDCE